MSCLSIYNRRRFCQSSVSSLSLSEASLKELHLVSASYAEPTKSLMSCKHTLRRRGQGSMKCRISLRLAYATKIDEMKNIKVLIAT